MGNAHANSDGTIKPIGNSNTMKIKRFTNGDCYIGEVDQHGNRHGWGVHNSINGCRYEGQWQQDCKHGQGELFSFDTDNAIGFISSYSGYWNAGQRHGHGKLILRNGDAYDGNFVLDAKHGWGTYMYAATGDRYEGMFERDQMHGKGVLFLRDGGKIVGEWYNGKLEGLVEFRRGDGKMFAVLYRDGKPKKLEEVIDDEDSAHLPIDLINEQVCG
jgi:hypothetical protein